MRSRTHRAQMLGVFGVAMCRKGAGRYVFFMWVYGALNKRAVPIEGTD